MRLPMYAKLLPFQELLLAAFFSASEQILHFSLVASVCRFETAKTPNETAKKIKNPEYGNWNAKKNWKQRKFRRPAIIIDIIAVSDFER